MRVKRSKQYRKTMKGYEYAFGFRSPYQVLLDDQIIRDASKFKLNLGQRLQDTLQENTVKPMISQCCIRHLYNQPAVTDAEKREKDAWIEVAKAAERRRCGHHELEEPLSTLECLESVVDPKGSGTNKHRYIIAAQDVDVRQQMRAKAGVPLVYINRSVMILEPMAQATLKAKESDERGKVRAGLRGRRGAVSAVTKRKREDDNVEDATNGVEDNLAGSGEAATKKKRVKGPKGPNPLSVRKSKKDKGHASALKQVEDERAVVRKATKQDPQVTEKASDAAIATGTTASEGVTEGPKKRKRKRKINASDDVELGVLNGGAISVS